MPCEVHSVRVVAVSSGGRVMASNCAAQFCTALVPTVPESRDHEKQPCNHTEVNEVRKQHRRPKVARPGLKPECGMSHQQRRGHESTGTDPPGAMQKEAAHQCCDDRSNIYDSEVSLCAATAKRFRQTKNGQPFATVQAKSDGAQYEDPALHREGSSATRIHGRPPHAMAGQCHAIRILDGRKVEAWRDEFPRSHGQPR